MNQIPPSFFDADKADFNFWKHIKEKDIIIKTVIGSYLDKVSHKRNGEEKHKKVWLIANKNKLYLAKVKYFFFVFYFVNKN